MTQLAEPVSAAVAAPPATSALPIATAPEADAETAVCPFGAAASEGSYTQTPRSTPARYPDRASHDRAAVHAVLDEALVCHIAFVVDGAPVVLPTVHARVGDTLYVHGSTGGRWATLDGQPVGVTVTLLDGLIFGRSWMHHSAPFRCVVVHGTVRIVEDHDERIAAMRALIEHVQPGRADDSREPSKKELAATAIVAVDLMEVSLKVRGNHVADLESDLDGPHWAGVIPLRLVAGDPIPAADLRPGIEAPEYAFGYRR